MLEPKPAPGDKAGLRNALRASQHSADCREKEKLSVPRHTAPSPFRVRVRCWGKPTRNDVPGPPAACPVSDTASPKAEDAAE